MHGNTKSVENGHTLMAIPGIMFARALLRDGQWLLLYVSQSSRDLLEIEPDDIMANNHALPALIHPEDRDRLIRSLKESAETIFPWREEFRYMRKNAERWCECISYPAKQQNGDIIWDSIILDITECRRTKESAWKDKEIYLSILETMDEAYAEYDLKGAITFFNHAVIKLLGYERDELMGMDYRKYHTNETAKYMKEVFSRIYRTGEPAFLVDYDIIRKDGTSRTCQMNAALMNNYAGKPIGFRTLVRDITERRKAEEEKTKIREQLLQAQKMESVGRLAGGVAHDFNNMLTVILGYAEMMKSRMLPNDPFLSDIIEIEKAASRSRDITRQLLAFSRKEIIMPRPVDLNSLIAGTQKTLLRLIGEDIDLRFKPGDNLWKIKVDPSQIEHLLINLAVNARDAMPNGGILSIETENIRLLESECHLPFEALPGHYVLLKVTDNGMGMDQEIMSHLFEPFFTTKEKGKGTGLGLATVYGIVCQNEGYIDVISKPEKGAAFRIYIPRNVEDSITEERKEETALEQETGMILLVEDDEMVRAMITSMLETIGYTVMAFSNPQDALSFYSRKTIQADLVVTDVVLPQMNGKELGDRIAALGSDTKILFMSGYSANVIAHRGVLEEGVHFIQKPFSMNDLAYKVREAIKGRG